MATKIKEVDAVATPVIVTELIPEPQKKRGERGKFLVAPLYADFKKHSKFGWVSFDSLIVDYSYQRPIDKHRVSIMAHNWDQDKAGAIVVNIREDNTVAIIDGQQRWSAQKLIENHPNEILAEIFEGLTVQQEARLFSELDTKRASLTTGSVFQALVTAEDQAALEIVAAAAEAGLTVNYHNGNAPNNLRAYGTLMKIHHRVGKNDLTRILKISAASWPDNKYWGSGSILLGIETFLKRYPNANDGHLIEALSHTTPYYIETNARTLNQALSNALGQWVARVILSLYNKGMKKNRLPNWEA